jgi:hypothetical protein
MEIEKRILVLFAILESPKKIAVKTASKVKNSFSYVPGAV